MKSFSSLKMAQILSSSSSKNFGHVMTSPALNFPGSNRENSKNRVCNTKSKQFKKAKLIAMVTGRKNHHKARNLRLQYKPLGSGTSLDDIRS
jgi:hypothetical protein